MAVSKVDLKIGGCDIGVDESLGYDLYDDISLVAGELKIQEKNSIIMIDIADAGIAVHGEGVGIDGWCSAEDKSSKVVCRDYVNQKRKDLSVGVRRKKHGIEFYA